MNKILKYIDEYEYIFYNIRNSIEKCLNTNDTIGIYIILTRLQDKNDAYGLLKYKLFGYTPKRDVAHLIDYCRNIDIKNMVNSDVEICFFNKPSIFKQKGDVVDENNRRRDSIGHDLVLKNTPKEIIIQNKNSRMINGRYELTIVPTDLEHNFDALIHILRDENNYKPIRAILIRKEILVQARQYMTPKNRKSDNGPYLVISDDLLRKHFNNKFSIFIPPDLYPNNARFKSSPTSTAIVG